MSDDSVETVNAQLVAQGLARIAKQVSIDALLRGMVHGNAVLKLMAALIE
jgi:hypothetical protein